jgi:hypothetical protein
MKQILYNQLVNAGISAQYSNLIAETLCTSPFTKERLSEDALQIRISKIRKALQKAEKMHKTTHNKI